MCTEPWCPQISELVALRWSPRPFALLKPVIPSAAMPARPTSHGERPGTGTARDGLEFSLCDLGAVPAQTTPGVQGEAGVKAGETWTLTVGQRDITGQLFLSLVVEQGDAEPTADSGSRLLRKGTFEELAGPESPREDHGACTLSTLLVSE